MRIFPIFYCCVAVLALFAVSPAAVISSEAPESRIVLLDDVLSVLHTAPGIKAAEARVEKARLQVEKAGYLRYLTRFELNVTGGMLPGQEALNFDDWGPFARSEISMIQPLFTFGKIDSATEMARQGLRHEQGRFAELSDRVTFEFISLYRGLGASQKGVFVAQDMKRDFDKLLRQIDEKLEEDDPDVSYMDRLEALSSSWQIQRMYTSTMEERTNLMRALNIALGADEERLIRVIDAPIPDCNIRITNIHILAHRAVERSPSIRSLRAAVAVADAKVSLEEANGRPDIFLGGGMRFNWASNRPSSDDYNSKGVAAFVGLRWRLDFWRAGMEVDLAKSDREAARQGLRHAEERVRLDIDKAVSDLRQEYLFLASIRDSLAAARTYARIASDNYDLGLGSSNTVINGYKRQYELQAAEIQSEYRVHVAMARLALSLGDIKKYGEWIKNEKIVLD
jgi:outer membrane protein TolC